MNVINSVVKENPIATSIMCAETTKTLFVVINAESEIAAKYFKS